MIKFKLNKSSVLSILNSSCVKKFWRKITNKLKIQSKTIQFEINRIISNLSIEWELCKKKKKPRKRVLYQPLIFSPYPSLCTQLATIDLDVRAPVSIAASISITISIRWRWLSSWRNACVLDTGSTNRRRRKGEKRKEGRRRKRQNWNVDRNNKSRNLCGGIRAIDLY